MATAKDKAKKPAAKKSTGKSGGGSASKIAPLRAKDTAELRDELIKLRREQFNLRMARATGQPAKPDQWSKVRRNIARLKTVLGEQAAKASAAASAGVKR